MTSVSGTELARLLKQHGWTLLRVQGSHHIYGKAGSDVRLSVPPRKSRTKDGPTPAPDEVGRPN